MKNVVLITGSTRGIGKAMSLLFANNKYIVVLNGRQKTSESTQFFKKIKKISPLSAIYYFDITNRRQVKLNCKKIINKYGHVDVLINNAGINHDITFIKMEFKDWKNVIETNLFGAFNVTKEILPTMITNNFGRIIFTSSIIAIKGNFGQTNYAAAKAGLLGLTKSLSKEVAKFNITVNAILPGFTETDMTSKIPEEIIKNKILPQIPMNRMAMPDEIANVALFLASKKSSYITGEFLNINGGML
jgi:3-oxoacyl-[acyl-carrier protein] reductase